MDTELLFNRRRALQVLGGAGLATIVAACGSSSDDSAASTTTTTTTDTAVSTSSSSVSEIPDETGGPYPGDGSNGPNVLTEDGVVRRDITTSFGDASGTAEGVPMTVTLTIVDVSESAKPLEGAAVYLWHCDREGRYSLYSQGVTDQNYLRGVQEADADGTLTFETIFPACYSGRWPHMHFEIYESVDAATSGGSKLKTSQLALPESDCKTVYATDGYEQSVTNLARVSLDSDNVFRDGWSSELATVSGSVADGYTASLTVGL